MATLCYGPWADGSGTSNKQSLAELKLRRLNELNRRLQEDLERCRIPVSQAALEYDPSLNSYYTSTRADMVSAVSYPSRTVLPRIGWFQIDGARCVLVDIGTA